MKLCIVSHKDCWWDPTTGRDVVTDGGFPAQVQALASLFDEAVLCVPVHAGPPPESARRVEGLSDVVPLAPIRGAGLSRKAAMVPWLVRNGLSVARVVRSADVVHAPIPGDIGTVGIGLALVARRRLFVRYCGNWTQPRTTAERLWTRLMESLRGRRYLMLATGGGPDRPSSRNVEIDWIFSTALSDGELERLSEWRQAPSSPLVLCTACRLVPGKGVDVALGSVAELTRRGRPVQIVVIGGGEDRERLEALALADGVDDRVRFTGAVTHGEVLAEMQRCDLFVYPTQSEGFPKVVLEALAVGLPTVSTDVSVIAWLVGDGGRVVGADPKEVADAIEDLVSDDATYAAASKAALAQASGYSAENWAEQIGDHMGRRWGVLSERPE